MLLQWHPNDKNAAISDLMFPEVKGQRSPTGADNKRCAIYWTVIHCKMKGGGGFKSGFVK